jgi:hypothetical protein
MVNEIYMHNKSVNVYNSCVHVYIYFILDQKIFSQQLSASSQRRHTLPL